MDNILRDGTQIDQTVHKDLDLNETASPAVSDFIVVPALYTGNLHIEIVAKEECEIHGEEITSTVIWSIYTEEDLLLNIPDELTYSKIIAQYPDGEEEITQYVEEELIIPQVIPTEKNIIKLTFYQDDEIVAIFNMDKGKGYQIISEDGNYVIRIVDEDGKPVYDIWQEVDEDTIELSPYIDIEYFDREKNSVFKLEKYVNIPIGVYSAGTIMSEFSLPFKFLKNIENGDKCYYVKISLNYVSDTSSGKVNAYLIWI
jgi:hypothetical protein